MSLGARKGLRFRLVPITNQVTSRVYRLHPREFPSQAGTNSAVCFISAIAEVKGAKCLQVVSLRDDKELVKNVLGEQQKDLHQSEGEVSKVELHKEVVLVQEKEKSRAPKSPKS